MKLSAVTLPATVKLVNVPTLVMFGCAFVVTVPATFAVLANVAELANVATFAKFAIVALPAFKEYVAFATAPTTLAPVIYVIGAPLPLK